MSLQHLQRVKEIEGEREREREEIYSLDGP